MATLDLSIVPADVTVTNNADTEIPVQFYQKNTKLKLPAGDTLIIRATTSAELGYYYSLAREDLNIAVEAKAVSEI
jgi:hypothetical protein